MSERSKHQKKAVAQQAFATRCVHGSGHDDAHGAARPPVYTTTTFAFDNTVELRAAASASGSAPLYTRYGSNPTLLAVERHLAALENAERALLFSSGMAAISTACLTLGRDGVLCLGNAYGGTLQLISDDLPELGIRTALLRADEEEKLEGLMKTGYGLLLIESPTNPDLRVQDIEGLARRVHAHGGRLLVDNTFATPVNQHPLALGADLVVHSATKFLGGHSDLTAGAAMGGADTIAALEAWRRQLGQTPAPETAALLGRSLTTLEVRVQRQNATAARIAAAMAEESAVVRVLYPGLAGSPDLGLTQRQMGGFGGMVSLELSGDAETVTAMVDRLTLFMNAPSLGGVESLVSQPAVTSHAGLSRDERYKRGIPDNQIRLSIGLEDPEDLLSDLHQALAGDATG